VASAEDSGTDDQRAEPAQPQLPAPDDEPAVVPEQFQARIDELHRSETKPADRKDDLDMWPIWRAFGPQSGTLVTALLSV
jgi:hypothetical protein